MDCSFRSTRAYSEHDSCLGKRHIVPSDGLWDDSFSNEIIEKYKQAKGAMLELCGSRDCGISGTRELLVNLRISGTLEVGISESQDFRRTHYSWFLDIGNKQAKRRDAGEMWNSGLWDLWNSEDFIISGIVTKKYAGKRRETAGRISCLLQNN